MTTVKTQRFPVDVRWQGGQRIRISAPGKPELQVETPPEVRGGIAGVWSPEELLVGSIASCYAETLAAIAKRRALPLRALKIHGTGDLTRRLDGRLDFSAVELEVVLETNPGHEADARFTAKVAEQACPISAALDTPVHVKVDVRATPAAA
jgi:organic hydroperoxide reductase OsmC/OhrA